MSEIRDRYGLVLTTGSTLAAEHYVEGLDLLLEQGFGPDIQFQKAVDIDDGFALAHAGLSLMHMFQGRVGQAKDTAEHAKSLALRATRRERQQVEAISLFIGGQGPKSLALIQEHLTEFPRDAIMLRIANRLYLIGCSGAGVTNFPNELYAMLKGVEQEYGDDWAFLGLYAFAHHEMGYLDESLRLAERSLAARPTSGHASHSLAHVYFETGDHVGGGDFLGDWLKGYDRRAPFHVHLSWHQALFELAQGRYASAVRIYEEDIRPSVLQRSAASLADSTSLMWRLRVYGGDSPPYSVDEICDQASAAAEQPGPAFRDAHAALVFATADDGGLFQQLADRLSALAKNGDALAREITLPLVQGIGAFAGGAYDEAIRLIEPVFPQLTRIGGSHAQREVFEDTLLEAYLRAEQYDKAEKMLRTRLKQRTSVRDSFWLNRVQAGSDSNGAVEESPADVKRRWQCADSDSPEMVVLDRLVEAG